MRTREERRQRAREVRWMIGVGAMLCLTFWGGMAFAFWVMGNGGREHARDQDFNIEPQKF